MGRKSRSKAERREGRAVSSSMTLPSPRATPWWAGRPFLVGFLVVALAAVAGFSLWARRVLWYEASTALEEFLIPLIWMALIFVAALAMTGLLADLLLPRPERVRDLGADEKETPRSVTAALFQPRALLVSLIFLAAAGVAFALAWSLSRVDAAEVTIVEPLPLKALAPEGRLSALLDQREVTLLIRSRAEDPAVRDAFFRQAATLGRPDELGLVAPRIVAMVDSPDDDRAAGACRVLAALGDRMNQNVRMLAGQPMSRRWEPEVLAWLRGQVSPYLRSRLEREALRVPVLEALAWCQAPGDGDVLRQVFTDVAEGWPARLAAATGLANMIRHEDLPALAAATREGTGDQALDLRVLWALQQHGYDSNPDSFDPIPDMLLEEVVTALAARLGDEDPAIRCAVVVALQAFQDARITRAVTDVFVTDATDLVCPRVEIPRPFGAPIPFVTEEELRFKMLNLLASVAVENRDLLLWLEQVSQQDRWKPHIREGLLKIFSQAEAYQ
ncbi:MAG: hypothetical protein ABIK09_11510 [Pseudomonadota bacterium]